MHVGEFIDFDLLPHNLTLYTDNKLRPNLEQSHTEGRARRCDLITAITGRNVRDQTHV